MVLRDHSSHTVSSSLDLSHRGLITVLYQNVSFELNGMSQEENSQPSFPCCVMVHQIRSSVFGVYLNPSCTYIEIARRLLEMILYLQAVICQAVLPTRKKELKRSTPSTAVKTEKQRLKPSKAVKTVYCG